MLPTPESKSITTVTSLNYYDPTSDGEEDAEQTTLEPDPRTWTAKLERAKTALAIASTCNDAILDEEDSGRRGTTNITKAAAGEKTFNDDGVVRTRQTPTKRAQPLPSLPTLPSDVDEDVDMSALPNYDLDYDMDTLETLHLEGLPEFTEVTSTPMAVPCIDGASYADALEKGAAVGSGAKPEADDDDDDELEVVSQEVEDNFSALQGLAKLPGE